MKNKEKYFDEIMDIVTFSRLAVSRENNKPFRCNQIECIDCLFREEVGGNCRTTAKEWLESEYVPYVDWSKVEVDTKVLVSDDNKHWFKRHFAKYEDGKIYAWRDGRTSWSSGNVIYWNHAKLYDEEESKAVTYYSGDKVYYQGRLYSAEQIEEKKNEGAEE